MSKPQDSRIARIVSASARLILMVLSSMSIMWIAVQGAAAATQSALCDAAAIRAARESGVPANVLLAITRAETGRNRDGRLLPWPWTVNMEGTGQWFATRAEALNYAKRNHERGARSFDIGCFQINYRWHGAAFQSIEAMFDPLENARYAARFLTRLHEELGDWSLAAGAYHSRSSKFARAYRLRFDRIYASIDAGREPPLALTSAEPALPSPRALLESRLPLVSGAKKSPHSRGSLVPLASGRGALISFAAGS